MRHVLRPLLLLPCTTLFAAPADTQAGVYPQDLPYRGEAVDAANQDFSYQVFNLYLPTAPGVEPPYPVFVEISTLNEGDDRNQVQWFGVDYPLSTYALEASKRGFAVIVGKVGLGRASRGAACAPTQTLPGNGQFVPFAHDETVYRDLSRPTAERDAVMLVQNIKHRIANSSGNFIWQQLKADQIVVSGHSIHGIVLSWLALGPDRADQSFPGAVAGQQDARPSTVAAFVCRRSLLYLPSLDDGVPGAHWPRMQFNGCAPGDMPMYPPGMYDEPSNVMAGVNSGLKDEASALLYGGSIETPTFLYYTNPNASSDFDIVPHHMETDAHSAWSGIARKAARPEESKLVIAGSVSEADTFGWYDERVGGNAQSAKRMGDWLEELFDGGVKVTNFGGGTLIDDNRPHIWGQYVANDTTVRLTLTLAPAGQTATVVVDGLDTGVTATTTGTTQFLLLPAPLESGKHVHVRLDGAKPGVTNMLRLNV